MDNNTQAVRRTLAVLLLALSFAAAACSTSEPLSARAPYVQTVPDAQFTVEFPGAPEYEEETVNAGGVDVTVRTYVVESADESVGVAYVEYPKNSEITLDGAAEGSAAQVKATIQSKSPTTFMGHPAMDVVMKTSEAVIHERIVARGTRLYSLIGVGVSAPPPAYARLVGSFVLH